jgi:hypothetical protein
LADIEKRSGQRMHHSEFVQQVLQLNPTVWIEQSINYPADCGFYTEVNGKKVFLSQFTRGWMPEFSYIILDRQELPDSQMMGWRAAIVNLLKKGGISWAQAERTFGDSEGVNSDRWSQAVRPYRQEDCCGRVAAYLEGLGV